MSKLAKEEKVHSVEAGQLIIHFDSNDTFLNELVDALITACVSKRCSMSHTWAKDARTERLILQLPPIGD